MVEKLGETSAVAVAGWTARFLYTLRGFGGFIKTAADDPDLEHRPLRNPHTGTITSISNALKRIGGTRHQSALRLCAKVAGARAFVVSQDGDLEVYWSTDDNTFGYHGLALDLD